MIDQRRIHHTLHCMESSIQQRARSCYTNRLDGGRGVGQRSFFAVLVFRWIVELLYLCLQTSYQPHCVRTKLRRPEVSIFVKQLNGFRALLEKPVQQTNRGSNCRRIRFLCDRVCSVFGVELVQSSWTARVSCTLHSADDLVNDWIYQWIKSSWESQKSADLYSEYSALFQNCLSYACRLRPPIYHNVSIMFENVMTWRMSRSYT